MLYVVSGHMRTGTSMMMRALEAGGLEATLDSGRDKFKAHFADDAYDPNEGGLYELSRQQYNHPQFPRMFDGKLIKILNEGIPRMLVMDGGIRAVFMRRDKEEIRQSYKAFFDQDLATGNYFQTRMDEYVRQIRNRKDVLSCHEFWYRDVVKDPLGHFNLLVDSGWAIDPQKAADIVDKNLCRYRIEELEVGIY